MLSFAVLSLALSASSALAATVNLNWDITWVRANPDSQFPRAVIGINNQWPCPTIEANRGDRIVIQVTNRLGNETTGLHFHGIRQFGSNSMDGPAQVTQCAIPPDAVFTYDFTVDQTGTFWYHSHTGGQYPDGLRGPMIIHDDSPPFKYDEELTLTASDWYHTEVPQLLHDFLTSTSSDNVTPPPDSNLLNDSQNTKLQVKPGKTYFVRIISMAAYAFNVIQFDQHNMTIVEVDGVYVNPQTASQIYLAPAQRYGVLITTKETATENFAFISAMDTVSMFGQTLPSNLSPNVTGYLVYSDNSTLPEDLVVDTFAPFDDYTLVPQDNQALLGVDQTITFNVTIGPLNGTTRAFLNNITYLDQKVPSLYTALSVGNESSNPVVYGVNANPVILPYNAAVQLVINNGEEHAHPFHAHGHQPQLAYRSAANAGAWNNDVSKFQTVPMRRDTILVPGSGHVVLRFTADNPGIVLFHCHIEWHVAAGMSATLVEAPEKLSLTIPQDHLDACAALGIPTEGNAAGNTEDVLDLTGANTQIPKNPWGAVVTDGSSAVA